MNDEHILRIKDAIESDESIRRYEYIEYQPVTGSNLNTSGEIRIIIESQDEFFHPSHAYILLEGQLVKKADGAVFADTDKVSLSNNGVMYLFNNIRYELSGHEIESINYPGQATTMKGLLKYSNDYALSQGMNHCWVKDTSNDADPEKNEGFKIRQNYIIKNPDPNGSFSFAVPLKHIFGFAEDYDKVTYGLRHIITLVRQDNNDAIFNGTETEGKVNLTKISLHMPRVLPNDREKFRLMKEIENKTTISVGFRMHQCDTITVPQSTTFSWRLTVRTSPESPRWVVVGFQTNRASQQKKNAAVFDHCKVKRVWIELNGNAYPSLEYDTDFDRYRIASVYTAISDFLPNYYGMGNEQSNISPMDFISLYPIHVIDISKQSEKLKLGVMDMNLRATFKDTVAEKTQAYALVISDRLLNFKSDGSKMNVTF